VQGVTREQSCCWPSSCRSAPSSRRAAWAGASAVVRTGAGFASISCDNDRAVRASATARDCGEGYDSVRPRRRVRDVGSVRIVQCREPLRQAASVQSSHVGRRPADPRCLRRVQLADRARDLHPGGQDDEPAPHLRIRDVGAYLGVSHQRAEQIPLVRGKMHHPSRGSSHRAEEEGSGPYGSCLSPFREQCRGRALGRALLQT
jgi:hypothetical protein